MNKKIHFLCNILRFKGAKAPGIIKVFITIG